MAKEPVNIAKGLGKGVEIAEEIRNTRTADNLFAGIFTGKPPLNKIDDWPIPTPDQTEKRNKIIRDLTHFLANKVDPYLIDDTASIPMEVFEEMSRLGLYGLKVGEKWGGSGLSQESYLEALSIAASWSSAIAIVLSADNTIGCKFPVMYYGTDEQKDYLLPQLVKWPTGFCLTEEQVGSDASKIRTYAVRIKNEEGRINGYEISGQKWYTTNGILSDKVPLAKYLAVVARIVDHPSELDDNSKKECFGLFIVSTGLTGFNIGTRNTFIGMRGIHNSNPKFNKVFVSPFYLIGEKRRDLEDKYGWAEREGSGLKIAFESLNTGRIAIAKGCVGASKQALNLTRWWANKRNQLGGPLADKELVRDKIVFGATNILAMEAMANYASICSDRGQDVRLEAAAAKTFAAERAWQIIDNMMQIRGGRGYEAWQSLSKREVTPPDDAIWLAARPNRIFEGSNEVMVQLIFREGTDKFIKTAMPLMSKSSSFTEKFIAAIKITGYYLATFKPDSDYVSMSSGKLARKIIMASARYRNKLALKQLMLDRFSRIAIYLGAISLTNSYAREVDKTYNIIPRYNYGELADLFQKRTRKEVSQLFNELKNNEDRNIWQIAGRLLRGDFDKFLYDGIIPMMEEHMRGPKKGIYMFPVKK